MSVRLGPRLAPRSPAEREALLAAAGLLDRDDAPPGFAGLVATWARDRDLLVGQGVLVELVDAARRPALLPPNVAPGTRILLLDMLAVRPEYRETGLEERILHDLLRPLRRAIPRIPEAVIYAGEVHAPVLLSTLLAMGPRRVAPLLAAAPETG